ncbi:unnamed protein product, partial [Heterotrigona itama]
MDGWMDGWIDEWIDGWMDWMDGCGRTDRGTLHTQKGDIQISSKYPKRLKIYEYILVFFTKIARFQTANCSYFLRITNSSETANRQSAIVDEQVFYERENIDDCEFPDFCPVTVSSSLTSSSASPVSATILSAGGSSLVSVAGTTTNHPLGVAAGLSNARMAVTSAVVRPPGSPTTSVSPSQGHPPPTTGGPAPTGRCCDTGRPIFTDPLTGQTVCSCQYELLGGYQRLGALPTAALSMYSAPYAAAAAAAASEGMAAYFPSLGAEQAPFYTPT